MNNDSKNSKEQLLSELAELRKESKSQAEMLKAANQQLRAANQQLEASNTETSNNLLYTLENMSDGFVSLDKNWKYTYVNKKAGLMLGRRPEDLIGKHIWTEFPEGIGQPFYKNYYKAVETKDTISFEDYYQPWDRWFENRVIPSEKGISIFFHDITERKQADDKIKAINQQLYASNQQLLATEQQLRANNQQLVASEKALKESESKLNVAQHLAKIGDFSWNVITGEVTWSDGMYKLLKYDKGEELDLAKVNASIHHPDDLDRITKWLNDCVESGKDKLEPNEYRIIRNDGKVIYVHTEGFITYKNGKAVSVFGMSQDITDRKLAEEELRISEEKFRKAFTTSPDSININRLDDGMYVSINDGYTRITGYSESDVIGKTSMDINIWKDTIERERLLEGLRKYGQVQNLEAQFRMKDGNVVSGLMSATVITLNGVPHIISITRDITERKQAAEKLMVVNQQLRASNQQLQSTEQQLRASNQELIVSQEALKESELKFQKIIYQSYAGIAVINEEGKVIVWNNALEEITGVKNTETIDRYIWDVQAELMDFDKELEKRKKEVKSKLLDVLKTGNAIWLNKIVERKYIHPDGSVKIVSGSMYTIKTHKGFIVVSVSNDVTESKNAEQKLKESEERFRLLTENTLDAIWSTDQNFNTIFVNNAVTKILGYSPEEFIALKSKVFISKDGLKILQEAAEKLISEYKQGNITQQKFELKYIRKDGKIIDVEVTTNLLFNDKKEFIGFQGRSIDITERKQAQETILELKEFNESIVKNLAEGIIFENNDGIIQFANPAMLKMLGYKEGELVGKHWNCLVPKHQIELVNNANKRRAEGESDQYEMELLKKNGEKIFVLVGGVPIKKKGVYTGLLAAFTDITERRQAEQKLKESEELFSKAFRSSPIAITITDQKTKKYVQVNKAWSSIYGYTEEETIGKSAEDLKIIDNKTRLQIIDELKLKGRLQNVEMPLRNKNGNESWVLYSTERIVLGGKPCILSTGIDITERNKAKKALKKAESNLQALLDNRVDSIWSLDRNYNFIVFNKPYADVIYNNMGIRLKKGMNALEIHPKDVSEFWKPKFDKVFDGEYITFEFSHIMDGQEHSFEVLMNPIYTDDRITGLSALSMDITQRKQAELELSKLSAVVKQSPSIISITDIDGKMEYVNPKFIEITGYSKEEVIGQNPRLLKSGKHSEDLYRELWKTISSGKIWRGEIYNKNKKGDLFWESTTISPIFDEQGKIINYIKVGEDITKQKRNEQIEITIHNISNAAISSYSPESFLVLVKDELGKIIDTTNFFVALYDDKTDSITLPFFHDEKDFMESFPTGKTLTNYVIKTGKTLLATKAVIAKLEKLGEVESFGHPSEVWLGVPLKRNNKITGIFAVQSYNNEDAFDKADVKMLEIVSYQISLSLERLKSEQDLKLAKERAEESNRLKTAFLNNMSHEIRTPLNGITGFIGLLQNPKVDEEAKQEYFDIINKSSNRLISTVTDIIDISRIEAGEVKVSKSEVSINEILDEQYKFFLPETNTKGIELSYKPSLSYKDVQVETDKHKLEGIFTNLIKNAIKFTETGSVTFGYEINSKEENNMVEFYVKDTGIGIPANRVDAIFNRFEQADIEDRRAFQGSGLGLAISKSYVEMLGGNISVKSKEGEGSTFTFTIPFIQHVEVEGHIKEESNMETKTALSQLSIIVAEDDETSKLFYNAIFKNKFKKIIYTSTGKLTIEKLRENPDTDIILMDIQMPNMNGYDATREIRKFNTDVVIIAQTAFGLSGDREKAIEAGCDDYISKPVNKDVLFEKIISYIDK